MAEERSFAVMNALSLNGIDCSNGVEQPLKSLIVYNMKPLKMRQIVAAVASMYEVTLMDILSTKRQKKLVAARHLAIYACSRLTARNYSEIGRFFGRDHSTVLYVEDKLSHTVKSEMLEKIAGLANIY